ncbi:replication factor C subunit 3 [Perkinsela sp. CCAP 1560/4]|nr:replication factor C subunit 3 [Perkinsela sp. CCAP 1560/4]|eukprot:KNH06473.1 replication factor C subunit 3 [Perkinsela sp. CCAP 1560/4]
MQSFFDRPSTDKVSVVEKPTSHLPWVETYRPKEMRDIISHVEIMQSIQKLLKKDQLPHLLFYGPPGTGKTTTILSCARMVYGSERLKGNVLELNASDERGIDVVRNQIKDFASTSIVFSAAPYKLIILDEADQMTPDAQAALRRVIEKYTRNVRFCIICNNVNKLLPALQSRCTKYRFGPLESSEMIPRLESILVAEKVPYEMSGIEAAARISNGDMRRCINILQGATMSFSTINEEVVYRCTGAPAPQFLREVLRILVDVNFVQSHTALVAKAQITNTSVLEIVQNIPSSVLCLGWPESVKAFVLDELAKLEHLASQGGSDRTSWACLVGIFQLAKEATMRDLDLKSLVSV